MYYRVAGDSEGGRLVTLLLEQLDAGDPALAGDFERMGRVLEVRAGRSVTGGANTRAAESHDLVPLIAAELGKQGQDALLYFGVAPDEVLAGLGSRARRVVGMNPSRMVVQRARARLHSAGLNHCVLQRGELAALPHPPHSFDVAVVDRVLAAADRPAEALREVARVLRPSGRLLVVENFDSLDLRTPDSNPLELLRAWLANAGLVCDRLRPIDVSGAHLLLAVAAVEPEAVAA
jgi:ArsR family transcriptional regulator